MDYQLLLLVKPLVVALWVKLALRGLGSPQPIERLQVEVVHQWFHL